MKLIEKNEDYSEDYSKHENYNRQISLANTNTFSRNNS